jgi:hypothetical protein
MHRQQRIVRLFSLVLLVTVLAVVVGLLGEQRASTYDSPLAPAPGVSPLGPSAPGGGRRAAALLWILLGLSLGGGIALLFVQRERRAT